MHRFSAEKKLVLVEFLFKSTAEKALKGLSGPKKKKCTLAHAWTGRWRTPTHTYHPTLRTLAHA